METGHPSTRAVNLGSGNRALVSFSFVLNKMMMIDDDNKNKNNNNDFFGYVLHLLLLLLMTIMTTGDMAIRAAGMQ